MEPNPNFSFVYSGVDRYGWAMTLGRTAAVLGMPFGIHLLMEPVRHIRIFREEGQVIENIVWRMRDWEWFGWFA